MNLSYTVKGNKKSLILMHGWGGSKTSLDGLQDELAKKGFQVYNLDLPGFGNSPLTKDGMTMGDYTDVIKEFIKEKNIKNPVLIGHSFGGKIATKIAIDQGKAQRDSIQNGVRSEPQFNISGIVVMAGSGIKPRNEGKKSFFKVLTNIGKSIFSLPILSTFYQPIRKFYYYYVVRERDYYKAGEKLAKTFINTDSVYYDKELKEISIPTLIIWGTEDKVTPLWMGEEYLKLVKGAKLEKIEGARHNLPLKNPEIVSKIIYNYLLY